MARSPASGRERLFCNGFESGNTAGWGEVVEHELRITPQAGGTFFDPINGLAVRVPPGAVSEEILLRFWRETCLDPTAILGLMPEEGRQLRIFEPYTFEPSGIQFLKPVSISLPIPDDLIGDSFSTVVFTYDDNFSTWLNGLGEEGEHVPAISNAGEGFATFEVMGLPPASPELGSMGVVSAPLPVGTTFSYSGSTAIPIEECIFGAPCPPGLNFCDESVCDLSTLTWSCEPSGYPGECDLDDCRVSTCIPTSTSCIPLGDSCDLPGFQCTQCEPFGNGTTYLSLFECVPCPCTSPAQCPDTDCACSDAGICIPDPTFIASLAPADVRSLGTAGPGIFAVPAGESIVRGEVPFNLSLPVGTAFSIRVLDQDSAPVFRCAGRIEREFSEDDLADLTVAERTPKGNACNWDTGLTAYSYGRLYGPKTSGRRGKMSVHLDALTPDGRTLTSKLLLHVGDLHLFETIDLSRLSGLGVVFEQAPADGVLIIDRISLRRRPFRSGSEHSIPQ